MLKTGLEFAQGTTDECKKLIARLFKAEEILGAYRHAKTQLGTEDIVLAVSEQDPSGFNAMTRREWVKRLKQVMGSKGASTLRALTIASKSAHSVARLPIESGMDALWLVVSRGREAVPTMAVLYSVPYATESSN